MDLKAQAPCLLSSLSSLNRNCHYTPPHKFCPNLPAVSRRRLAPATMGSAMECHLSVRSLYLKVQEDVLGSLGEGGHHLPHVSQVCPSQRCRQPVVGRPDFRSIARTTHSPSGPSRHGLIRVGTQPPQNTPLALLSSHYPIPLSFPRKRAPDPTNTRMSVCDP